MYDARPDQALTLSEAWSNFHRAHPDVGMTHEESNLQFPHCDCERCHPRAGLPLLVPTLEEARWGSM